MQSPKFPSCVALVTLLGLGIAVSCSNTDEGSGGSGAGGNPGVGLGTGGSGASNNNGSEPGSSQSDSCTPQADDTGCVGVAYEGESASLDILVMFDLSCSMSCTVNETGCCLPQNADAVDTWRIQPVREAMKQFLQDPATHGIGIGLSFFGNHALNANRDPVVCSVEHYVTPAVEIATLPGNAPALISALDAGMPQGGTPTHLAIDGACVHSKDWRNGHPGHKVVILLVTDGIPEYSCNATIQAAVDSATNCYAAGEGPQVYVLGVDSNNNGQGKSLTQLNAIAVAGGTNQAYITQTTDVASSVLTALNAIRADAAIPCDLNIPTPENGQVLDPATINIGICGADAQPIVTPYVREIGNCGTKPGWYYDDPNSPATIHLCDATCATVQVPGATLFFSVGCATQESGPLQ